MSFSVGTRLFYDRQTLLDLQASVAINYEERRSQGDRYSSYLPFTQARLWCTLGLHDILHAIVMHISTVKPVL